MIVLRLFLSFVISLLCLTNVNAQTLKVESFAMKPNDLTARTQARQDINGVDCALVKVQLAASGATFDGNVVGDVKYNTSEYWVYMAQGSKRLSIRLEGYLPLEVNFEDYEVKPLESKTVYILVVSGITTSQTIDTPRIKTGWIILESEPTGASIYINDEFVGNTPLTNYKQAYGTYSYRVEKPNYHPSTGAIELNSAKLEKKIELKPAFGSITITSSVAGANILLDGNATNKTTPCTLEGVPSGQHTITIQKDKYSPRQQSVTVEDGQTAQLSLSLDARFARVSITSLDGAQIYCNGELKGTTRHVEDLMEGYYDIEARLAHHKAITKQIQVKVGQAQEITINPTPIYGSLDVTSTPHDADVTIDGKQYGKTPLTIEQLLEGGHQVVLSKEGFSSYNKAVIIKEGETETVSAELQENRIPTGIQNNNSALYPNNNNPNVIDLGLPSNTKQDFGSSKSANELVKEAKKLYSSGNLDEAVQKLTPALTSAETTDKAAAWNLMNDIQYKIYSNEYDKLLLNQPADTLKAVTAFLEGFKAANECDKYAQQPNEKGKVKNPYRKTNAERYLNQRHLMYNLGVMCYQHQDMKGAIKTWESYIGTGAGPVYADSKLAPDTLIADAAYNSAYLSYMEKDYDTALALAEKALTYPGKEEGCLDLILYTMRDKCTNHADSLTYLARLKEAHKANPERDLYFNMLQDYYVRANDADALMTWAREETQINANNKMAWALLGEAEMNNEHWDEAIEAFKKAVELDPNWVPVVFNTGICYNSKAITLNDQLTDKKTMRISNENAEKVKEVVREAQKYLEKTRELDPNHEQARWTYPLYRIYYTLGLKDKMAELETIDPSLKDI